MQRCLQSRARTCSIPGARSRRSSRDVGARLRLSARTKARTGQALLRTPLDPELATSAQDAREVQGAALAARRRAVGQPVAEAARRHRRSSCRRRRRTRNAAAKKRGDVKPHGQIRQSQIVTTFGPGAMVDLPDHAVIVGGLDHWTGYEEHPIVEERLAAKVADAARTCRPCSSSRRRRTTTIRPRR